MMKRLLILSLLTFTYLNTFAINCLPEWKYNRTVTFNNINPSAYTDLQVKVVVNTQTLISAGKMKANGDDIRFTDSLCNNLNYWIDSNLNTTTTVIWVKLKHIPASGNRTIYMWYGNHCASAGQNGDSTFILFDDFSSNTLNTSKWTSYNSSAGTGNYSISGGAISLNTVIAGGNDITFRSNDSFPLNIRFEAKVLQASANWPNISLLRSGSFTGVNFGQSSTNFFMSGATVGGANGYSYNFYSVSTTTLSPGVWGIRWNAVNNADGFLPYSAGTVNNNVFTPGSTLPNRVQPAFSLALSGQGRMSIDWVHVRQNVPLDPVAIINAENNNALQVVFTPVNVCPGNTITITANKFGIFFGTGNTFKIELSDASGNFGSPYVLASVNDTVVGSNKVDIPKNTPVGTGYKIRITSTSPAYNCFVSSANLNIYPKPTVAFHVLKDSQCYKYNNYNFVSTSSISSGTIDSFIWKWDDGSKNDTLLTNTVSHSFKPFYPYYYPKLTAISNHGCHDSASGSITILETPDIKTQFNDTIQCFKGNHFTIQSVTKTFSGIITSLSFDPGDGTGVLNNIDSFTHKYSAPGIYQVRQINTHQSGCVDTNYLGCLVNVHPVADINTNDTDQCLNNNAFIFEANSTITNGLPLINYWDLGGSETRDMQDSVHYTYPTYGNRTVRLITISDDGVDGCADTTYQSVLVNPMPKALITNTKNDQCFNYNKFNFLANSSIPYGTLTHNWNFGDNSTTNASNNVNHSYASDGSYTVKMYAISNKGCTDSATTSVVVRPTPVPAFTMNAATQCYKYHRLKAKSNSTISSGTFSKLWMFSEGTNYTNVDSLTHYFTSDGNYALSLILTSNYNCQDTLTDSIHILPMPLSDIGVNSTSQCYEGNNFAFTDNSSFPAGTITGNKWLFDDNTTLSNQSNPNHQYAAEGVYNPGLIVYGNNGCFDTSFVEINVNPHPGSDFFINDTGQCVNNNSFQFLNNTFITSGTFTNRWNYGDGSPNVDALNATKKYTKDGTYRIRLISFSDQGCTDTAYKSVTVFPKATSNFTIDNNQQCVAGNNFNFASTTTVKYGTFTTNWTFGDGNGINNTSTASHSYLNVGSFNVRLISQTNEGCLDTINKSVRTLAMPVANYTFNYSETCWKNNQFEFNSTSAVPGNASMTNNWYFGDNDSSINTTAPYHYYKAAGVYTVRLISYTNIGLCADTIDKIFTVNPMPVASFIVDDPTQCFLNNAFNFNSTSNVASGTIDQTNWNLGDNTTSTAAAPTKSYTTVDSFKVILQVVTNKGCVDADTSKVYVYPMPKASFTVNPTISCFRNNLFKITNKSSIGNGGNIAQYQYYYGNNDSSLLKDPLPYSYKAEGAYTILQRVTSDKGCWDTATADVTITPNPVLSFTVNPVCLKDSSEFINTSTISSGFIQSWRWKFGDGKTSTLQSPKHKYKSVGSYDITLMATTNNLCSDTLFIPASAVVNANPKAGFYYTKERSWENEVDIQYTDTSSGAISWKWDFAAMGTSADQNPKLYYIDTLTQLTRLIVTNTSNCKDTVTKLLFIAPDVVYYMPSAFTPNEDNINETFKPIGLSYAINYKFVIFNRWGEIMFSTDNPQLGWNGKFESNNVPQDLYFYRLEFVGVDELRHEEKGSVMILR